MEKQIDILFVCTGNICRSPAAMYITKHSLQDTKYSRLNVSSAGVCTLNGESISQYMYELLDRMGIDASLFASTMITKDIVAFSKLIMVMDRTHKKYIDRVFPGTNVYFLGDMADGRFLQRDITDPFGMLLPHYEECLNIIKSSCLQFIKNDFYGLL